MHGASGRGVVILRRLGRRGALMGLLLASLIACGASSASAAIVHLNSGKTISYQPLRTGASTGVAPFDQFFSNLDYNGGPVMPSNTNYVIYWSPSGPSAYPAGYQSGVNQYLEDLAHDSGGHQNVDSVSTQYNDAAGQFANYESHFGGAFNDESPYPANGCTRAAICLTDAQLAAELTKFAAAHELPTDLTHEYFLVTPKGVEDCFQSAGTECSAGSTKGAYCAYHSNVAVGEGQLIYSNDPFVTENPGCDDENHPNGSPSDGLLQGGLSHEHNESITDPEPNSAWADIGGSGGENGDKCRTFKASSEFGSPLGKAPNGAKYNQVINGHFYWYQQEWSNQGKQCLQRFTFSGEQPTATFADTSGTGNSVSFDATGSRAPGGVARYNWQFNDGPGLSTPVETTVPTVSHTFPTGGFYVVALTVFAADGTSIGTARTIQAGKPPAPSVGKLAPKTGPAAGGTSVTITGSGFAGATAVTFGASEAASFTVNSPTSITAVAPAGTAGTVDIRVTAPTGTSPISAADHFKYGSPTVTGVSPNSGSKAGGTSVAISGSGFALGAATTFKFGKAPATSVNCTSTTSCTASAPAATKAGVVDVKATVAGPNSKKNAPADHFSYS
jgi:hypothetical protein